MSGLNSSIDERMGVEVVVDARDEDLVALALERDVHVVLHLPFGVHHVHARRVVGRHQVLVDERQDAELLHSASRCRPLCRKFMACTVSSTVNSRRAVSSGTARRSFRSRHRTMMSSSTWSIVYW